MPDVILAPDWFRYREPNRDWIAANAKVPGFAWRFFGGKCHTVDFHRSHLPLMPVEATVGVPVGGWFAGSPLSRGVQLRDYQRDDIPFLLNRRASILGYEMRLGKTATACAAHDPQRGPLVIVGPLIARDVWRTWCERVHGFAPVALESKHDVALPGFPAYFVHFDILDYHSKFFSTFNPATLILDEVHLLQARRSMRISAASILAARAGRIIALSGTPMWTNPRSMWPILNLLAPGAWGTEFDFSQRYTNAVQGAYGWKYEGTQNESELRARLNQVVVRRTWHDVLGALPPTTNVVEPIALTNAERVRYESLAQKAQLANVSSGKQSTVAGYLATLRRMFGQAKIPRAIELARRGIGDGHKVVLWTWHNDVAEKLCTDLRGLGIPTLALRAEDSQSTREIQINMFQAHAGPCAMVSAMAVGGVAIDLSASDLAIFVELDWIPATIYQAAMRTFHPSRPNANVYLFADVPIERRLVDVLACNEACQTASGLGYEEIAGKVLNYGE